MLTRCTCTFLLEYSSQVLEPTGTGLGLVPCTGTCMASITAAPLSATYASAADTATLLPTPHVGTTVAAITSSSSYTAPLLAAESNSILADAFSSPFLSSAQAFWQRIIEFEYYMKSGLGAGLPDAELIDNKAIDAILSAWNAAVNNREYISGVPAEKSQVTRLSVVKLHGFSCDNLRDTAQEIMWKLVTTNKRSFSSKDALDAGKTLTGAATRDLKQKRPGR
jgi:hypothetical protein